MIKKIAGFLGAVIIISLISFAPISEAALVEGYVTGDNITWVWDYSGSGTWGSGLWYPAGGWGDWKTSHLIYGDANPGEPVDIYFAVKNASSPGPGNPAGFLGSLTTNTAIFKETGTNKLLTDTTHWGVTAHTAWTGDPAFDPTLLTYGTPTSYGKNTDPTIWYGVNGGPIDNIDGNAEWLWTDKNFNANMDQYAVFYSEFTVVPEPASMALVGIGLLGALGGRLRKKKRG